MLEDIESVSDIPYHTKGSWICHRFKNDDTSYVRINNLRLYNVDDLAHDVLILYKRALSSQKRTNKILGIVIRGKNGDIKGGFKIASKCNTMMEKLQYIYDTTKLVFENRNVNDCYELIYKTNAPIYS